MKKLLILVTCLKPKRPKLRKFKEVSIEDKKIKNV